MVQGRNSALSCDASLAWRRGNSVPQRWPPLPTYTSAHAGLRGWKTGNADSRHQLQKEFFFLVQAPLQSGERARTRTIHGDSIRFIFLPWWGQIDRKTHAGVEGWRATFLVYSGSLEAGEGGKNMFLLTLQVVKVLKHFQPLLMLITITTLWSGRDEEEEGRTLEL